MAIAVDTSPSHNKLIRQIDMQAVRSVAEMRARPLRYTNTWLVLNTQRPSDSCISTHLSFKLSDSTCYYLLFIVVSRFVLGVSTAFGFQHSSTAWLCCKCVLVYCSDCAACGNIFYFKVQQNFISSEYQLSLLTGGKRSLDILVVSLYHEGHTPYSH